MKKQGKSKSTKQAKLTPEYDSQRETRVLLEEMNQGIKTIGEQHGSIVKRLDNIESKFSQHDQESQIIKSVVQTNSSELKSVKLAIKDIDDRTQRIEKKLDVVTTDHEQRLQKLEAV